MTTTKKKEALKAVNAEQASEPLQGELVSIGGRATLDHEAGLVRDLLVQRYREFGTELFEERGNELVGSVRRIFARLAAPLEESEETEGESVNTIDVTTLGDPDRVVVNAEEVK
ncbi:hypothetical protein [Salmonella enterica]|uniref:hypothetical protein n=1 Tax=Salmonella enterica TaxID=28901 RepID=UPI001600B5F2|nr:hypothetical protein [Salmonella enterica]MDO3920393.1 hypothetical protein [Salmonella enterica]